MYCFQLPINPSRGLAPARAVSPPQRKHPRRTREFIADRMDTNARSSCTPVVRSISARSLALVPRSGSPAHRPSDIARGHPRSPHAWCRDSDTGYSQPQTTGPADRARAKASFHPARRRHASAVSVRRVARLPDRSAAQPARHWISSSALPTSSATGRRPDGLDRSPYRRLHLRKNLAAPPPHRPPCHLLFLFLYLFLVFLVGQPGH